MKKIKILVFILICLFYLSSFSQKAQIEKGNKQFQLLEYSEAIKSYQSALDKGATNPIVYKNLADCYYLNSQFESASLYYKLLLDTNSEQDAEIYYRYAQSLKAQEKYTEASGVLEQFIDKKPTDSRAKLFAANQSFLDKIKESSSNYIIEPTKINTSNIEYGGFIFKDHYYFTAYKLGNSNIDKWTNQSYSRIYYAPISEDKQIGKPELLFPNNNSDFNESSTAITKDGKTLYFTRNDESKVKAKKGEKSYFLKIYKATFNEGTWSDVVELPFNSNTFNTANPTLSTDEKTLYFASDRPESIGQSDLYKVSINNDGTYGKPTNLGPTINTESKENFPYIASDNNLYFSSDGRPGLGGLDIYVADFKNNTVTNLGKGINSAQDDFALLFDETGKNGFLSSNRKGGNGFDDIYRFILNKPEPKIISGRIYDISNNEPLKDAEITLVDDKGTVLEKIKSDSEGKYSFTVTEPKSYTVKGFAEKYQPAEQTIIVTKENVKADLGLLKKQLELGDDLTKVLPLKPLYFDLNKWNIRPDAELELAKVVQVMTQFPKVSVAIGSHTDSRASSEYNLDLSDKRAKATMNYLIKKGIDPNRLSAQGYGETKLINRCSDGVKCSEEEHQENRRSEFIVIKK